MHRQSLGSPNSKQVHSHGSLIAAKDDDLKTPDEQNQKRKDQTSPLAGDDEVRKSQKPQKSPERLIHLIPMLIIFCFLILYLSSHDPSQKALSSETDEFGRFLAIEKSDVLATRSLRNLQELDRQSPKNLLHRKIGDF